MNYANYKIFLDMHDISTQTSLAAKQGDTGRKIFATLTERGVPFVIGENCTAVFTAKKPDGNIVFNNCSIENNIICYTFTPQTTAAAGKLDCEIRLYDADNFLITSPRFNIIVAAAVYNDGDEIESTSEVNTLTSLISEATTLISTVNSKLDNGDFIPQMSVGTVATLPAGSMATVEITGTGAAPVLNFGIPQGDEGQAEGMIPDAELSLESTRPVQNKVITAALNEKADAETVNQALSQKANAEAVSRALNLKADAETVNQALNQKADIDGVNQALGQVSTALGNKVDKAAGKGLSTNDFTNEEKQKLAGIEAGANKFVLADGAVTRAKLADDALYSPVIHKNGEYYLSAGDIGKTIRTNASGDLKIILTQTASATMPVGTEIAILPWSSKNCTVKFDGVYAAFLGETATLLGKSFSPSEKYSMIAIKKIISDTSAGDHWLITGNVEVVA